MANSKDVKVLFNTIQKDEWRKSIHRIERLSPFYEIEQILKYINNQPKKSKFRDLSQGKFYFLESSKQHDSTDRIMIFGSFKSARNKFRPNLINKRTGIERPNPKEINEGDIEKTHFGILIDSEQKEVFCVLEHNPHGVNMKNFIDYLKVFKDRYLKEKSKPINYTLKYETLLKDNFLEALNQLKSAKIAEVSFNKQLLGSEALNFSDRLVNIKQDLKLTISSNPRESIKSMAVDLFNAFNREKSQISKVRIKGVDNNNNDVLLDTSFMNKSEYIKVELNPDTGELNGTQIFTGLKEIIEKL